jgi:hypothetical protein
VRVEGRGQRVQGLSSESVSVTVRLPGDITPGVPTAIPLQPENAVLPEGVFIVSFSPEVISVTIDRVIEVDVTVRPDLQGEPGAGLTREDIRTRVRPETVRVRGPSGLLTNLQVVATEPVDVSGRAIDFSEQRQVVLPDPALAVQPVVVTVEVMLEPAPPSEGGAGL